MANIIDLNKISDIRGELVVIEKILPFDIKRVFFINGRENFDRGGHKHKKNRQALLCINGSCIVECNNGMKKEEFILDTSTKCLIVEPEDWHIMKNFSNDSILLVLASENYDKEDYIYESYEGK